MKPTNKARSEPQNMGLERVHSFGGHRDWARGARSLSQALTRDLRALLGHRVRVALLLSTASGLSAEGSAASRIRRGPKTGLIWSICRVARRGDRLGHNSEFI